MRKRWILALLLALFGATFLAASQTRMGIALLKSKRDFRPLPEDPRLWFAPGQMGKAVYYASYLDDAIAMVSRAQLRDFAKPFRVYIPASQASFNEYTAAPPDGRASGTAFMANIFLSPDRNMPDPKGLLAHELSHLHLFQHAGFGSRRNIPEWFVEGLAVKVSGMGTKDVSEADGRAAIAAGKTLIPHTHGGLLRTRRAKDHGINHFLYYRQSQMFVVWLEDRDPERFKRFLNRILDGASFRASFREEFGFGIPAAFESFKTSVLATAGDTPPPAADGQR